MFKKITLMGLGLFCLLALSACHVPILDKEITLPFFEKKPEKAMGLMEAKMKSAKTYKSDFKAETDVEIRQDGMGPLGENFSSLLKVALPNLDFQETKVLGINNFTPNKPEKLARSNPINPFSGSSETMDLSFSYDINSQIDKREKDNIKMNNDAVIEADFGNAAFSVDFATRAIGDDVYFKVKKMPFNLGSKPIIPNQDITPEGQWFAFKMDELKKLEKEIEGEAPGLDIEETIKGTEDLQKKYEEKIKELKELDFIRIDKRLRDEKIDDNKCYHYKVSLNKKILKEKAIPVVIDLFKEQAKTANIPVPEEKINKEIDELKETLVELVDKGLKKSEGEIWVDKDNYYLRQQNWDIKIVLSDMKLGEVQIPKDALKADLSFTQKNYDFGKDVKIEAPEDAISLIDLMQKQLEKARKEARDSSRLSDVKNMQTALEMYYVDNNAYPTEDIFAKGEIASSTVYMRKVPSFPKGEGEELKNCPADFEYSYTSKNNGESYQLKYCLEEGFSYGAKAGINIATPAGISVDSEEEAERQVEERDKERLSDIKQIQTALELYYSDKGKYTDTEEILKNATVNSAKQSAAYMDDYPQNPKSEQGECPSSLNYLYELKEEGKSYNVYYCLEDGADGVENGFQIATPAGVAEGEVKDEENFEQTIEKLNKIIDSDQDGLNDYEEINIYGTDIYNEDTDGDGYSDGSEVENGYNPNGEGELEKNQDYCADC